MCGCKRRCRESARRAGWLLQGDGWWRHPTNGEPPFHDSEVDDSPTRVALARPSISLKAPGVIAEDGLAKVKDLRERFGIG